MLRLRTANAVRTPALSETGMALRDTIKSLQTRADEDAEFQRRKPEIIETWRSSVIWLEDQIAQWLAEYEKDGTLSLTHEGIALDEELLGAYQSQGLKIVIGPIVVRVRPVARMIIGGVGRVDMYREGRSSDGERVLFIRLDQDKVDTWAVRRPKGSGPRIPDIEALTKESFESMLDMLLK